MKINIAAAAITLAVAAWAAFTVKQARRDLRQVNLLYDQMEHDHGDMVRQHFEWRRKVGA